MIHHPLTPSTSSKPLLLHLLLRLGNRRRRVGINKVAPVLAVVELGRHGRVDAHAARVGAAPGRAVGVVDTPARGEALQNNEELSLRATAKLYNVPESTLRSRRASKPARRDTTPNSRRLTDSEEKTIVQHIIELALRYFPPRLRSAEDMANQLLRVCDAPAVGKLWAYNFVRRQLDLRTCWTHGYNYQRAKCEDPKVIAEWFAFV